MRSAKARRGEEAHAVKTASPSGSGSDSCSESESNDSAATAPCAKAGELGAEDAAAAERARTREISVAMDAALATTLASLRGMDAALKTFCDRTV